MNLGEWEFIFAVPCSVVDKYIKSSSLHDLKTLLWILRNKEINEKKASDFLDMSKEEFEKSFKRWKNLGIFCSSENKALEEISENSVQNNFENKTLKYKRPSGFHVASRIRESTEISTLIKESEMALGRPISGTDSAVLIMLHDNEGLPSDVILMLIEYAVSIGKGNIRFIESMGNRWAKEEIDSIEKAEKKINNLDKTRVLWKKFENIIGIEHRSPTSQEQEAVLRWHDEWKCKENLVRYAYEICVDTKGRYNIRYMDGILKRWYLKGISAPEQVIKYQKEYRQEKLGMNLNSYSIEDFKNYNPFES